MKNRILKFALTLALLPLFSLSWGQVANPDYDNKLQELYQYTVKTISCDSLSVLCDSLNEDSISVTILDTRPKSEFDVSHMEAAQCVGYDGFNKKKVKDLPKDAYIVVYCSVGYRSERIGEKLQKWGYTNVHNLYGGLFEWVNKDLPVVDEEGEKTDEIHAFSEDWGVWLSRGKKVFR